MSVVSVLVRHEDIKMAPHHFLHSNSVEAYNFMCNAMLATLFSCFNHMCIRFLLWFDRATVSASMIKMALVALDKIWYYFPTIGSDDFFKFNFGLQFLLLNGHKKSTYVWCGKFELNIHITTSYFGSN